MKEEKTETFNRCTAFLIKKLPNLLGTYLFGSFGTDYETPESDIDFTVFLWNLSQELSSELNKEIELIDFNVASTVFRYQILTEGKRIYC